MSTTNRITVARNSIKRAIINLQSQISTDRENYEVEINDNATIYLDATVGGCDYDTIEISELTVLKEGGCRNFSNITSFIECEIQKTIDYVNAESKSDYEDWNERQEYESIGGKFAYLSY